jgi:hypothetical protein
MQLRTRVLVFRTTVMLRRANRRRRRRLEAELATFRSQAELDDLCAMLDSYPDGQTREVREILAAQQLRRLTSPSHWPVQKRLGG